MLVQVLSLLKSGKIIFKKLSFNKVLQVAENTLTALKKTNLRVPRYQTRGKRALIGCLDGHMMKQQYWQLLCYLQNPHAAAFKFFIQFDFKNT